MPDCELWIVYESTKLQIGWPASVGLYFILLWGSYSLWFFLFFVPMFFCWLYFFSLVWNGYSQQLFYLQFHCFPSLLYQKTDFVFFNRFLFQPTFSRLNVLFQLSPSMHLQLNCWPAPIWLYCLPLRKILQVSEITDLSSGFISWCLVLAVFTSNMFFFKFFYFSDQQW